MALWAGGDGGTLVHWDGTAWKVSSLPNATSGVVQLLGFSPNDLWAFSSSDSPQHWNGSTWTAATDFAPTVTYGIVSGTHRYQYPAGTFLEYTDCIQVDSSINPGNSGGGLFNIKGEVIGINAMIASPNGTWTGYGFAIPINIARSVAKDLIKTGKVNRGYIGVRIRAVDQTEADAIGLDRPRGVRVDDVTKGEGGDLAGLKQRDVILSVDGHNVDEPNTLQSVIGMHHAGDKVQLRIWRDGKELEKTVTLRPRPDLTSKDGKDDDGENAEAAEEAPSKTTAKIDAIGLAVRNLTAEERDKYHVSNGVMITSIDPASEASDRGLQRNLVITEADYQKIKSAGDLEKIIAELEKRLEGKKTPVKISVLGCVVNGPGEAKEADIGIAAGNALNWRYVLDLKVDGKSIHVDFDDWMYQMDDDVMLNRARMSKFGVTLGEVTLSFRKRR